MHLQVDNVEMGRPLPSKNSLLILREKSQQETQTHQQF